MQSGYWLILSSLLLLRGLYSEESSLHDPIFEEEIALSEGWQAAYPPHHFEVEALSKEPLVEKTSAREFLENKEDPSTSIPSLPLEEDISIPLYPVDSTYPFIYKSAKRSSFSTVEKKDLITSDIDNKIYRYTPYSQSTEHLFMRWEEDFVSSLHSFLRQHTNEAYIEEKNREAIVLLEKRLEEDFREHPSYLPHTFDSSFLDVKDYSTIDHDLNPAIENKRFLRRLFGGKELSQQAFTKLPELKAPVTPKPLSLSSNYLLKRETYPDYSVGSALWAKDILGSFRHLKEGEYAEILMKGASHLYQEEEFALFSFPYRKENSPIPIVLPTDNLVVERPLLVIERKALDPPELVFTPSTSLKWMERDISSMKDLYTSKNRHRFATYRETPPSFSYEKGIEKLSLKHVNDGFQTSFEPILFQKEMAIRTLLPKTSPSDIALYHFDTKEKRATFTIPSPKKIVVDPLFEKGKKLQPPALVKTHEKSHFVYISSLPQAKVSLTPPNGSFASYKEFAHHPSTKVHLEKAGLCFSKEVPLVTTSSLPRFYETATKREISFIKWGMERYIPSRYKLSEEAFTSYKSSIAFLPLHRLPSYQIPSETLSSLIGNHFLMTPELFSLNLLVSADPERGELGKFSNLQTKTFSSSILLYPVKSKEIFSEDTLEAPFKKKLSYERLPSTFSPSSASIASFTINPPESGKHALLYPISNEGYDEIYKSTPSLYLNPLAKEGLYREKLIEAYLLINNVEINPFDYKENYFDKGYHKTGATILSSEFQKVQGRHTIYELALSHLEKITLVDLDRLLPFTSNYLEGISLLNIRFPSSYHSILEDAKLRNRTYRCTAYTLASIPTLQTIQTESLHDEFTTTSAIVPQMSEDGYIFSLALAPKEHFDRKPLRHHIYFLIDRSSSIERHRFDVFKNAVSSAITFLSEDNLFNVFMFDNKVEPMSLSDLRATKASIKLAKDFLDRQTQPWLSSSTSLLDLLNAIHDRANGSDDVHTAIVLTSGNGLKNIDQHKAQLKKLLDTPKSNFFVHSAIIGAKNNIPVLDLFSGLYGGSLLYSHTHAAFPRKLAVLTKNIKNPIVTDLHISLVDQNDKIEFHHNPKIASYLCKEGTMTFMGTAKELSEFDVLIQGRILNRWVNIRQHINLQEAIKGRGKLEKQLALQRAYNHFAEFLVNGDVEELTAAAAILKPFNVNQS